MVLGLSWGDARERHFWFLIYGEVVLPFFFSREYVPHRQPPEVCGTDHPSHYRFRELETSWGFDIFSVAPRSYNASCWSPICRPKQHVCLYGAVFNRQISQCRAAPHQRPIAVVQVTRREQQPVADPPYVGSFQEGAQLAAPPERQLAS